MLSDTNAYKLQILVKMENNLNESSVISPEKHAPIKSFEEMSFNILMCARSCLATCVSWALKG